MFGVDIRLVDDEGREVARDGQTSGHLQVRGSWVASGYFKHDADDTHTGGWFLTGDVATIDLDGYMQITDRSKDVIKSGGEWISSIDTRERRGWSSGRRAGCGDRYPARPIGGEASSARFWETFHSRQDGAVRPYRFAGKRPAGHAAAVAAAACWMVITSDPAAPRCARRKTLRGNDG